MTLANDLKVFNFRWQSGVQFWVAVHIIVMDSLDIQKLFFEGYLDALMDSAEGRKLRKALEATCADEKLGLEEFKKMISHCQNQLDIIQNSISAEGPTKEILSRKRAFEEELAILNIAALTHQCDYETKGYQRLLYFEKNDSIRKQIMGNVRDLTKK